MAMYTAVMDVVTDTSADSVAGALRNFDVGVAAGRAGEVEIILRLPAESLPQATQTALAVVAQAIGGTATTLEVLPSEIFDSRHRLAPMPQLLSLTEAAVRLGISRPSLLGMLERGNLPGQKVGANWVIPRDALSAAKAAVTPKAQGTHDQRRPARPRRRANE